MERLFREMVTQPTCEGTARGMIDSTVVQAHQHSAGASQKRRGGHATKVIAVVTDEDGLIAVDIAEGQRNDAPLALPVLAEAKAALGRIDEVLGDEGFDLEEIRVTALDDPDTLPVIPNLSNRVEPWPWDDEMRETYE